VFLLLCVLWIGDVCITDLLVARQLRSSYFLE
jgi:hypothetical protein